MKVDESGDGSLIRFLFPSDNCGGDVYNNKQF